MSGTGSDTDLAAALRDIVRENIAEATEVSGLIRLSGGANQETWSFDALRPSGPMPLILRRASRGGGGRSTNNTLDMEAELLGLAKEAGVPVPTVRYVLTPDDGLGSAFVMDRIEGETIARKILRDAEYAEARPKLARQCGGIAAHIHSIPKDKLPEVPTMTGPVQFEQYRSLYEGYNYPHPVFELAFKWLEERVLDTPDLTFVHGDFRHGNLIIGSDGVRAVLDWEIGHIGDPMEDLGWICVNSWRFGNIDSPVGGFGAREDMFEGYEAAGGGAVDPDRVKFWEVFGSLKWGIMCMGMYSVFQTGLDRTIERAAIGRRSSEAEMDLMLLLREEI